MRAGIADRDIDPGDKALLRREACQIGVSMEELVRRLIHEKRTKTERRLKPSEACARIMEEELRRGAPLDDQVPDAFLAAAAATRGLAVVTRSTGEFRNTGVETVDPWTAEPQ